MTRTIEQAVERYRKKRKALNDIDAASIDVRFAWAQNDMFAAAVRLADLVERHVRRASGEGDK